MPNETVRISETAATQEVPWREELLGQFGGLGPFAFTTAVENKLSRRLTIPKFKKRLEEDLQLAPFTASLERKSLVWLLEMGIRARAEDDAFRTAKRIVRSVQWRRARRKMSSLREAVRAAEKVDVVSYLRKEVSARGSLHPLKSLTTLSKELDEFYGIARYWKLCAQQESQRTRFRSFVRSMDRYLARKYPSLLKYRIRRAQLVSVVMDAVGLKTDLDAEALMKMLQRDRKRRGKPDSAKEAKKAK